MPIFYKDEHCHSTIRGHVNDVGGMNPGSWGLITEIFQEDWLFTSHFYKDGKLNTEVVRLILHNSRIRILFMVT